MAKAKLSKSDLYESRLIFFCPGCKSEHAIPVDGPRAWQWNGSIDSPTLSPSILRKCGPWGDESVLPEDFDPKTRMSICHSFVKEGKIQFLSDCTHHMAGQTVELGDYVCQSST